eukprot:351040-Chlamydomonas_euryale.AAC.1
MQQGTPEVSFWGFRGNRELLKPLFEGWDATGNSCSPFWGGGRRQQGTSEAPARQHARPDHRRPPHRSRHSRMSLSSGSTSAVLLVTASNTANFVWLGMAAATASTTSSTEDSGRSILPSTTSGPHAAAGLPLPWVVSLLTRSDARAAAAFAI